jgi:hypothetical protein
MDGAVVLPEDSNVTAKFSGESFMLFSEFEPIRVGKWNVELVRQLDEYRQDLLAIADITLPRLRNPSGCSLIRIDAICEKVGTRSRA